MSFYKISFFARQFIANDRWLYKIIKLAPASNVRHRRIFAAIRARSSTIVTYKARVHELHTLGKPPAPASASSACRASSANLAASASSACRASSANLAASAASACRASSPAPAGSSAREQLAHRWAYRGRRLTSRPRPRTSFPSTSCPT